MKRPGPRIDKSALAFSVQGVTNAPDYLKWLRGLACVVCYARACDPAHLRLRAGPGTGAGVSQKNDRFALPLCRPCHDEQHRVGERVFWESENPHAMADRYWQLWPGREKWEAANG